MPFLIPSEQSDTPSSKRLRLSVEQTFETDNILPRQKSENQSLSCNSQSNSSFSPRPGPSNSKVASHNFQSAGLSSTSQSHNHVSEGFGTMNEPLEAYDTHFNEHFPDNYSNMVEPDMNYSTHNVPIDLPGASVADMNQFNPSMPFSSGGAPNMFPSLHEPTPSRLNEIPPPPGIHHQPVSHNGLFSQPTNRMSTNNFQSRTSNNRQQIHVLPSTSMYYNSVLNQLYPPNYSNYERSRPQQCYCPSCDTPLMPYAMPHSQCRQSRAPMLPSYGHASSSNLRNGYFHHHHHHHYEGNNIPGFGFSYNCNHMMQPPPSAPGPGPMQPIQQSQYRSDHMLPVCVPARPTSTTQRRTNVASSPSNFMAPTSTSSQSQPSNPNRTTHLASNHNHQHHIPTPFRPINQQPSFYFPVNVSRQVGGVHPTTPTMPVGASRRILPSNSTWVTNQPPPSISASVGGASVALTPYPTRPVIFTRGFPRPIMQPSTGVVLTVPASSQTLNVLNSAMARYSQDDVSAAAELHFNFGYENLISLAERLGDVKPQGLMKSQIDKLKSYVYQDGVSNSDQHTCVVCICEWEPDQKVRVLPCKHEFHAKCVDRWLKEDRTCPICRYEIKDEDSPPSN